MTLVSIDINIRMNVYSKEKYFPLTGTYSTQEEISGFINDRAKPLNINFIQNNITTSIGGFEYNLLEGTLNKQWDGGVVAGCELNRIQINKDNWTPEIKTGEYTLFDQTKHLFSNYSSSTILLETDTILNVQSVSTLSISLYKRDNQFNNIPVIKYQYQSPILEDSSNVFDIEDLEDETTNIVVSNVLESNINLIESIEFNDRTLDDYERYSEFKGYSVADSSRFIYSNYFPIKPGSLKLYSYSNIDETFEEWIQVENIYQLGFENDLVYGNAYSRKCFDVDFNTGKIRTTGLKEDTKYFLLNITNNKSLYVSGDISHWPSKGSFSLYNSTTNDWRFSCTYENNFENILEQVRVTSDQDISIGGYLNNSYIKLNQSGYNPTQLIDGSQEFKFFISYTASPLIEYETSNLPGHDIRFDRNLNLKPIYLNRNNGIIQISPKEKHVSKIVLTCDKTLNRSDIYESLFFGIDQSRLQAVCLDSSNQPVSGIEVEFKNYNLDLDPYVYFEGLSSNPITKVSNRFGNAYVNVVAPYEEDLMRIISTETNGRSLLLDSNQRIRNYSDIVIYQTLRYNGVEKIDDPEGYLELASQDDSGLYPPFVDRLLYHWDEQNNRYTKVIPIQLSNAQLMLNTNADIPVCFNQDPNSIVYQYKIFFSRIARIQCTCIDPATGIRIYSNIIDLKLELPLHLKGVNSLNIPYGFGIKKNSDDFDVNGDNLRFLGSGLGGANFLTINPSTENILNLKLN